MSFPDSNRKAPNVFFDVYDKTRVAVRPTNVPGRPPAPPALLRWFDPPDQYDISLTLNNPIDIFVEFSPPPPPGTPPPAALAGFTFGIQYVDFGLNVVIPDYGPGYPFPDNLTPLPLSAAAITLPTVSPTGAGYPIALPNWPTTQGLTEGVSSGVVVDTDAVGDTLTIMPFGDLKGYTTFANDAIDVQVCFLALEGDELFYAGRNTSGFGVVFTFWLQNSISFTTRVYQVYVPEPGVEDTVTIERMS